MTKAERVIYRQAEWMARRSNSQDHGCLTGDCPHDRFDECVVCLAEDFIRQDEEAASLIEESKA